MDRFARQHDHRFDSGNPQAEKTTWRVVLLTAVMMFAEIAAGLLYGSLALFADGLHMGTHVVAFGITVAAYALARKHADDPRFAFGTWKLEILGGFASAILLGAMALFMVGESIHRLLHPDTIDYVPALVVAVIGLVVNLVSALLLHSTTHEHSHGSCSSNTHHSHDLNLRAAYLHVVADAFTSLLAIGALWAGLQAGWNWLDPLMGIVGAAVISLWSVGLIRDTGQILLDREMDHPLVPAIRNKLLAQPDTSVVDLHVWRVGRGQYSVIVSLAAKEPKTLADYRTLLSEHPEIVHLTIEIDRAEPLPPTK